MRQNLHILFLCLTLAFASACVQVIPESGETPEPHKGNLTLTVGMEASRSTLDGLSPRWVEGDALSAINASGNYKLWLIDAENGVFSGDVKGDYPFLITYPYNEDYTAGSYAAGTATLSIPATQTLAHGQNVAPGALVAAGVLRSGTTVTLKNLVSLVKLTVNRGDLTSISFSSTEEGEPLCGTISLDPDHPGDVITDISGTETVTLLPEGACFEPGTYYLSVVPRDVSGVSFSFTKSNGSTAYTREKEDSTTLSRGGSLNFGNFFEPTVISTKEQLIDWKNSRGTWTEWDFVKIGANINLEGDYWPGVDFSGEMDGRGHAITNIKINADRKWVCFFSSVSGYVHDLTLGSPSDDSYFTSTATYGQVPAGGETAITDAYVGPVGQVQNGGRIENITNYVPVTASGDAIVCAGGICAYYYGAQAEGLLNYGSVSVSSDVHSTNCNIGGIIGYNRTVRATLTSCTNTGNISSEAYTSNDLSNVGGLLGVADDCGTDISSCISRCSVNAVNGSTYAGVAFGRILPTSACTVQSTGVSGTAQGTALTAGNWSNAGKFYGNKNDNVNLVLADSYSCYFIQEQ